MDSPTPYQGSQPYIFVSYAHRNINEVYPILLKMEQRGFRIWYDDGINPGSEWDDNIAAHVNGCDYFIAFLSQAYLDSENCRDELNYARSLEKSRLLVYLDWVELPPGMSMRLNRLQAVYLSNFKSEDEAIQKIAEADGIGSCIQEPEIKPAPTEEDSSLPHPNIEAEEAPLQPPKKRKEKKGKEKKKKKKWRPLRILLRTILILFLALVALIAMLYVKENSRLSRSATETSVSTSPTPDPLEGNRDPLLYGRYGISGESVEDYLESAVYTTKG